MEQHHQGLCDGCWCGTLEPVHVDEVVIGRAPAASPVLGPGSKNTLGVQRRPNGLEIPAWQPQWCGVVQGTDQLMQNLWRLADFLCLTLRAGAGVVHNEAPALWRLVVHVGRQHVSLCGAVGRQHFHHLQHMMNGAGQ